MVAFVKGYVLSAALRSNTLATK